MTRVERAPGSLLSPREWRFVRVGALVSAIALITVYGVLPFARHWNAREALLAAERDRLARLESLVAHRTEIDSTATARERSLDALPRRVLRARAQALAAASLQSLLQDMAEASNVTVTRLDVATASNGADPSSTNESSAAHAGASGPQLPVTLSANGDIYGLAAFLGRVRSGPRVVVVDRLMVQVNSALRGAPDVLQMTVSLHAPVILE